MRGRRWSKQRSSTDSSQSSSIAGSHHHADTPRVDSTIHKFMLGQELHLRSLRVMENGGNWLTHDHGFITLVLSNRRRQLLAVLQTRAALVSTVKHIIALSTSPRGQQCKAEHVSDEGHCVDLSSTLTALSRQWCQFVNVAVHRCFKSFAVNLSHVN